MQERIEFETPENVTVSYVAAGLGTRFLAWLLDGLVLTLVNFCLVVIFVIVTLSVSAAAEAFFSSLDLDALSPEQQVFYMLAFFFLFFGFGSFFYFAILEFFMRGQTIGKRVAGIRVVRTNGFRLEFGSILVRNVFRVVDQLPLLWLVPLLNGNSQRLGDIVSGTVVIHDNPESFAAEGQLRQNLLAINPAEMIFRITSSHVSRLRPVDVEALERLLIRFSDMTPFQRDEYIQRMVATLTTRLDLPDPEPQLRLRFLEELLAVEFKRQYRQMG